MKRALAALALIALAPACDASAGEDGLVPPEPAGPPEAGGAVAGAPPHAAMTMLIEPIDRLWSPPRKIGIAPDFASSYARGLSARIHAWISR